MKKTRNCREMNDISVGRPQDSRFKTNIFSAAKIILDVISHVHRVSGRIAG